MSKKTTFGRLHLFWIFVLLALASGTAFAAPPRAYKVYITSTVQGPNPSVAVAMKVGQVLRVYYTYIDPDPGASQAENTSGTGTTITWWQHDDETGANPVQIGTGSTFSIPASALSKYISVRVTPKNLAGEVGATSIFEAFDSGTLPGHVLNKNKVISNTFTCSKAGGGTVSFGNNVDATAPLCSPRNAGWEISYTGIDFNNANAPKIFVNWNDGGGYQTYSPTLVNPLVTRNDTINLTNSTNMVWRTNQTHQYNYTTTGGTSTPSTTANQVCTYTMQVTWGIGTFSCASSAPGNVQTAPFTVWDKENNTSLGTFDINHTAGTGGVETGEITDICVGDRTAIRVQDASDFNCTSTGSIRETVTENTEGRWVQFVYGTTGSTVTTGPGATEKITINGVDYLSTDLPVYGKVTWQPPATTAPLPAVTDDIQMPTSGTTGQILMVTMRSWNYCNQLDRNGLGFSPTQGGANNVQDLTHVSSGVGSTQPAIYSAAEFNKPVGTSIYANANSVDKTYTIRLKTKPLPPTYSPLNFCEIAGSGAPVASDFNITFGNPNGVGTYTLDVYPTAALSAAQKFTDNSAPFTFNPVNQGPVANQIDVTPPPANPNVYHKYATLTGSNNCVSDPLDVEIRIQAVKTSGTISHALGASPKSICTGTDPAAFTVTATGGGNNDASDDLYQWQQSTDGGTTWVDIAAGSGGTVAAYDPPALTATTQFRRRVRESWYNITGGCDEAFSNVFQFTVDTPVQGGTINNDQTVCGGVTNPAAFGSSVAGSGGNGTPTYSWQFSTDNFGADINTIPGATSATYDPPSAVTADTYYRRVNTSGVCVPTFAYSNIVKLTVEQPIVPGTISSDQIICNGQTPVGLTGAASTGGSGTYTYQWEKSTTSPGTSGFSSIGGANGLNFAPGALTQTTWYRRLTTAGVCAAQYSNTIQVTVNPLPTVASVTGGGSVCSGNPAPDITFTFTGTPNFNFVIRQTKISDGTFVDVPVNNHNALTYTITDPTPAFDTKYQIFSLADANSCNATTLGGSVNVTIGGTAPNFDTAPSLTSSAVCFVTGGSPDPALTFSLDVNGAGSYTLVYKADGSTNRTKTFSVTASGDPTVPITFNDTEFDPTTPTPHVLRIVSITTPPPGGCQSIFNVDLNFTVNPLPQGANKTLTAVCSPDAINIDIFNTSVATAAGGNNVTSTYTWTASYGTLTGMATSGNTATLAGTLTNPSNTVQNAVFTITPKSTATPACSGSTFTITVPVNPVPKIFDRTQTICSGAAFSITPVDGNPSATTIVPAGTKYTWTITPNANISGASNQATPQGSIGQTLTNLTEVPQAIRYTVTPTAGAPVGSCVGGTFFVDVTVNPTPKIADIPTAVCSGTAFSVIPANAAPTTIVPTGTTYAWAAPVVTGGVTGGAAATGQTSISQTLTNPSTSPQTATYTVTPTSGAAGSCVGATFKVIVTVNPIPKLSSSLTPPDICTGTFFYHPTSLTGGATFTWSRPNIPGINESASSGNNDINETLTNPTTSPVDVTYTIITTANTCSNTGQDVVVRVNPTPLPNPVIGPANVCVGTNPFFYSVTQRAGSTYSWEVPASFTVEAAGGGVVAGGGPGAFTSDYFILLKFSTPTPPGGLPIKVIEKSGDGCIGSVNDLVIVAANSPPTVPIGGGNVFCKGQQGVVFSVPQNSSSTFTWSVSSGAHFDGPSAGTNLYQVIVNFDSNIPSAQIDVTETNVTGCPASYPSLVVSLLDEPKFIGGTTATICSGEQPSSQYDLDTHISVPSNFTWVVTKVTGTVTGVNLNDTGSGPLEHLPTIKNTSGADAVIEYTVTATGSAAPNCKSAATVIKITVKPEPIVNAIADQIFCPNVFVNGALSFPLNSNVSGATMNWTSSNPAIGLAAASGSGNISFTSADNLTGADITSIITVSATSNGCTSIGANTKTFTITIKPRPVITQVVDIVVCPGDNITIPNFVSNTPGGETYAWTNDNTTIGLGGSGSGNINSFFAAANNSGVDKVANISVTATRLTCAGPAMTFKITVRPQPVVTSIANQSYCAGETINIPLTSNVGGATINWLNSNTAVGLAASGTGDITGTAPANNTGSDINATITVSAVANGCTSAGGNTKTFTITIKPTPIVNAVSDIVVCSGATIPAINFASNIASGVTYNWTNSNPAINLGSNGTGNIAAFTAATNLTGLPITGTISVTGVKNTCSGPAVTFNITVSPEPVVTTVAAQEFCPGDAVSIPLASNVVGATINWTNSNTAVGLLASGTGSIAFTAPANNTGANIDATIVVTATKDGCTSAGTNSKTFTIRIKPTPIVNAISDITVCSGQPISTIVFAANTGGAETFSWTNDNIAIGFAASGTGNITGYNAPVNVSGVPIVANITVSAARSSCAGPTKTFKITVNPEPVVTSITNKEFCPTESVNIPFASNVVGANITWTNSNPAIGIGASGSGDIVYVAPANNTGADIVGTITVTATNSGCASAAGNSKTFTITIKATPIVNAITNITVCSGSMVTVPSFGSNISSGVTYAWTNDETAIGLAAGGTGNITAFPASPNTTSSAIVATISVIGTRNLCSGPARTFTITVLPEPVGTNTDITLCSDVAVGVNLGTLITSGAAANRYNITITNSAGLSASAGAPADGTNLTATEIQNDKWTNQTGVPHDIVYHITPISGGSPACTGTTFDFTVHVNPEPIVTLVTNKIFCPGESVNIPLTSNVAGANINWANSNLAVGLASTGTGDIVYTAPANNTGVPIVATIDVSAELSGCTSAGANKKSFTITIKPTPIVDAITDVAVCSNEAISAINFTANTGGSETFSWTNNNTAVGLPATGTGNIGAYTAPINVSGVPIVATISVSASRLSCSGPVKTFKITVNPEPVVAAITDQTYCPGESVTIPFTSNVAGANITWTNDNTAIGIGVSGSGDIVYVAPSNNTGADIVGNITVKASKNSCISDGANLKTFKITIKPTPIVNAVSNVTVCSGGSISAITFGSNVPSGGVTFDWTNDNTSINLPASGSGNIGAFTAGLNLTSTPMVATISVTGTKNFCTGPVRTFTITILPQPVGTSSAVTVCSDAAVAVNLNSMISGAAAKYDITITNSAGLPASAGSPVNVVGATASEIQDDRWTNITGSQKDIVYHMIPTGPGSPGCVGNAFDLTVHVDPEPVVTAVLDQEFCPGATVNIPLFSNVAGASITWTNTNTVIGLGLSGSGDISFTAPANNTGADIVGTVTVNASLNGCQSSGTNTKQFKITIKPTPIVDVIPNVIVCSGTAISTINFTANTGGGETYTWTNNNTAIGLPATGSTNIPGYTAPTNFTGVPIVATIGVSAVRNSCPSPVRNFTITISPEPVVAVVANQAFCAGETVNVPLTSNVPGASISWTNTNSSIGIGTAGSGDIIYTAPANNTGSDIIGTITVSATKDGCLSAGSNKKTFTITIKPTPIVNTIADIVVCSGGTVNVPAFGSNVVAGGVTFNWTNDNPAINLAASGSGDITSFTAATNVSGVPMTAEITYSGIKNTCSGPSKTFKITINPEPVVDAITDKEYCPGAVVNIPLTSNVSGALISWTNTNPAIGIGTSGTGDIIYTAPVNVTGSDFVATITVVAERNSCVSGLSNQKTFQIRIKAAPVVATVTAINVCSGDMVSAISFTSNADPGVTFDWTNDNTAINLAGSGTGNIGAFAAAVNTGGAPMIANVSVHGTKNGCTGVDMVFKITVFPEPVLGITPNAPICSRGTTNITLATNGTSIGAQGFRIDNIEYSSNGGPFSTVPPASFTFPGTNKLVGAQANDPTIIKNDAFTNLTPFTVTVRYTVTPYSVGNAASPSGCFGDAAQVTVDVNPEPDLDNSLSPAPICSGVTVVGGNPGFLLKADPASVAATSFIINNIFPNGLTPGSSNATTGTGKPATAINNDSWVNTGNTPVDVTYEITPVTGSCLGQKENVIVRVNPSPAVKDGLDRVVCDDTNSNIVLQDNSPISVAANSYVVTITVGGSPIAPGATVGGLTAAGTNFAGGTTTDVNAIKNDHFKNNTNDRIVVTYTVVPISAPAMNSCPGPAKQITLMVEPTVKSVSLNNTLTICSGNAVDITFGSPTYANGDPTNPSVTFSYSTLASAIQGATVGNNLAEGDKITDVLVNTTNNPITVHYRITPRAAAAAGGVGCAGSVEDVAVIVQPMPRINNIANKNVCEGQPVNLSLVSTTNPIAGGTIKIFVTATADPEVTGFSNGVLFNNNSSIVDALSNSASTTKQVTYHLEVRNVDGANATICTAGTPIDVVVSVSPTPIIAPIADFAVCSGTAMDPVVNINTDTEASGIPTSITWTVDPNPSVGGKSAGAGNEFSQTLTNNTSDKQTVVYHFKAINISNSPSCASGITDLRVTVYPNPKVVGLPRSMDVCNNGFLNPNPYVLTPSTVPALGTTFDWVFDDGINPQSNLVNQTQISQMFTNPDPFQAVQTFTIDAHLTIPAGANPMYGNTCVNQSSTTLFVNVAPQVGGDIFTTDLDGNEVVDGFVCRGATSRVTLEPSGLQNFFVEYSITNSSGTTDLSYTGSGGKLLTSALTETTTYLLKRVTDKFNCKIDINKSVTVNVDAVDVSLSLDGANPRCQPFDAQFRYNEVSGVEYTWHWGDGNDEGPAIAGSSTANQTKTHQFLSTSSNPTKTSDYKVTYEASLDPTKFLNGCRKTSAAVTVKVYPTVVADIAVERDAYCSDDNVKLSNSTLGATTNHWFYTDENGTLVESSSIAPVFQIKNTTGANPTFFDIFYDSDNGHCPGDQKKVTVAVYRGIDAHFQNTTPTIYMAGESNVTFTNDSDPVDNMFRYEWNFGADSNPGVQTTDGSVTVIPVVYKHPGSKTITLEATNIAAEAALVSCASEFSTTINIPVPILVADFDMIPEKACFPAAIEVTANRSTGDTFEWTLFDNAGIASTSNIKTPTFRVPAPGQYTVQLVTTNIYLDPSDPEYQKSVSKDVIIYDLPTAQFTLRPTTVYVPDTEMITYNISEGAQTYLWDFGDGETSDEKAPTHTYKIENVYDVTLVAYMDHDDGVVCSDTAVMKVTAKQGGITRVPNAFTPNPNGPVPNGTPGANSFNDVFLPQVKGAEEFNMQIFDRWGNLIFESNNSNVGWDGYTKDGKLLPAGVYVYKLTLRLSDGQRTTQVGDITMIR